MSPRRASSRTTPGVERTKSMKLRPLAGRFAIMRSLTTELTADFDVSISGASLETVTAAWTPAGSRTSRTLASLPFATRAAENPARSAPTSYVPTGTIGIVKVPTDPEVVFRTAPVSTFRAVTATFGIAAPDVSTTVPLIEPVVLWPKANDAAVKSRRNAGRREFDPDRIIAASLFVSASSRVDTTGLNTRQCNGTCASGVVRIAVLGETTRENDRDATSEVRESATARDSRGEAPACLRRISPSGPRLSRRALFPRLLESARASRRDRTLCPVHRCPRQPAHSNALPQVPDGRGLRPRAGGGARGRHPPNRLLQRPGTKPPPSRRGDRRRTRRTRPRHDGRAGRAPRRRAQDCQRHSRQRLRQGRGVRRRHSRGARGAPTRLHAPDRPRPDRRGFECARAEGAPHHGGSPADLSRPPDLRRAAPPLRGLSGETSVPEERGLPVRGYLSGAIEHAADGGRSWREEFVTFLRGELRHEVYDPAADEKKNLTDEELAGFRRWKLEDRERFQEVVRKIIAWDLERIENETDYVVALWDRAAAAGGGTAAEVTLAYRLGKPVYLLLGMPAAEASGWVLGAATEVFDSVAALESRLRERFGAPSRRDGAAASVR